MKRLSKVELFPASAVVLNKQDDGVETIVRSHTGSRGSLDQEDGGPKESNGIAVTTQDEIQSSEAGVANGNRWTLTMEQQRPRPAKQRSTSKSAKGFIPLFLLPPDLTPQNCTPLCLDARQNFCGVLAWLMALDVEKKVLLTIYNKAPHARFSVHRACFLNLLFSLQYMTGLVQE